MATTTTNNPAATSAQSQGTTNIMSYADNPLTQLPTVDFNFEDLRKRMADFTVKFDAFIETGRKRVLEERNEFRGRLGEINEEQRSTTTQITTLNSTLSTHNTILTRESHEKSDIQTQIHTLQTHQTRQLQHRDHLRSAIAQTKRQIDAKLLAQREYSEKVDAQSRLNGPELLFWETYLGCRIEGAGDECLVRVVFTFPPGVGEKEKEREAGFELKVPESGGGGYEVVYCKPKVEETRVQRVVQRLNETRDISVLLKGMRTLFAEVLK